MLKKISQSILLLTAGLLTACLPIPEAGQEANEILLPGNFYFPTVNDFTGFPGCYLAAYSRPNGDEIEAIGQVRVPGRYEGRICQPTEYEGQDVSAESVFSELFEQHFPQACSDGRCWAGGDTGGFLGIP